MNNFLQHLQKNFYLLLNWALRTSLKIGFALIVTTGIYLIYLDSKITQQFSSYSWNIPTQVFAKPITFYSDKPVSVGWVRTALSRLNYTPVKASQRVETGQYVFSIRDKHHFTLTIGRRDFTFSDGWQAAKLLSVVVSDGRVTALTEEGKRVAQVRLEAPIIARLMSSGYEDREYLHLEDMPEVMKDALLLVEDRDFYHHHGISLIGIARAMWRNLMAGRTVQGGSTLTQQLAKNMFLTPERSLWRKFNEVLIALVMDFRFSKDEILEAYSNEIFLGQHGNRAIHGFGLASQFYFGKPLSELSISQVATLVAMIKGPSYYNPHRHPQRAEKRRDVVLRLMFEHHYLSREEYEASVNTHLKTSDTDTFITHEFPAFTDVVKRDLKRYVGPASGQGQGLKVYTSFDLEKQLRAEKYVLNSVQTLQKQAGNAPLQIAFIETSLADNGISVLIGDKKPRRAGFNRVLYAQRNIGSLVKPFIYLSAWRKPEKFNLATLLEDKPIRLKNQSGQNWSPQNYDKQYVGKLTALDALVKSRNIPSVNLGMKVGISEITRSLYALGLPKSVEVPQYPSMLLGALPLSPLQVNQLYTTVANNGEYLPLTAVTAVKNLEGATVWKKSWLTAEQRVDEREVFLLQHALQNVMYRGTGKWFTDQIPEQLVAGKTGTTNEMRDSWFTGFDQHSVATVWIGADSNMPINLTGSSGALRVFTEYRRHGFKENLDEMWAMPKGVSMVYVNPTTQFASSVYCEGSTLIPMLMSAKTIAHQCR